VIPEPFVLPRPYPMPLDPILPLIPDKGGRGRGRGMCKKISGTDSLIEKTSDGRFNMLCSYSCQDGSTFTTIINYPYERCPDYLGDFSENNGQTKSCSG
jgi:hypothetical protein